MSATLESRTLTVRIERALQDAYAFLSSPENFALWASGLGKGLARAGTGWTAETPGGPVEIGFAEPNAFGVLDHRVRLASGQEVAVPMRVIANGGGCEVLLTLLRQPDMTPAQFAADAEWVQRDLQSLKRVLEGQGGAAPAAPVD